MSPQSLSKGQRVRVTAIGPHAVRGVATIHAIDPVRFADGEERVVYILRFDEGYTDVDGLHQDTTGRFTIAGDGEFELE